MNAIYKETNQIDPSCVISADFEMGFNNIIGPYCIIGPNVVIGDNNHIVGHVCIGTPGQFKGQTSQGGVKIGSNNTLHTYAQVQQSMDVGSFTVVGDNCYLMTNSVVAHDCIVENDVTMCNNATLGGYTQVRQGATLGYGVMVHQNQDIGAYSMLGMGTVVPKSAEIEPGETYAGNPAKHLTRNLVGLMRNKIPRWKLPSSKFKVPALNVTGEIKRLAEELNQYTQTRDRSFQSKRYDLLSDLIKYLPYLPENDAVHLYNMAFALCWQQHEDFQADQTIIRELLIDTMGPIPASIQKPRGPIAWLVRHAAIGTYAPYKHVQAYLSGMEPCTVYIHGSARKQEVKELQDYGHTVYQFKGPSDEVADAIKAQCKVDGIAVLISEIYTSIPLLVFQRRAAPLQVYLSPGFQLFPADLVLIPETQEIIGHPRHVTEFIPTAVLPEHLYKKTHAKPTAAFGILTRAEKMSRRYLEAVIKILEATGAELHIYGKGQPEITHPQFRVKGIQNAHEALDGIKVYLDSFPTCGGLSCYEAMAHGVPVISREHGPVKSWNAFKPCVVSSDEEYISAAIAAWRDNDFAKQIAKEGLEIVTSRLTNIPRAVTGLYKALRRHGWQP